MQIVSLAEAARDTRPRSVALGVFDGLHLGHRAVIRRAVCADGSVPTLFTFSQKPWQLPKQAGACLLTESRRNAVLETLGVAEVVEADFEAVRGLTPAQFVREVLRDTLHAVRVTCGFNYRFGAGGAGDVDALRALCAAEGIAVEVADAVQVEGQPVSASRIRTLIEQGDMQLASRCLGYPFTLDMPVAHGRGLGHRLGTPTINQPLPEGFVQPRFGVWLSAVTVDGRIHPGVTNIGVKPTVGAAAPAAETWILDYDGDLYGQRVPVQPLLYLRDERRFADVDALAAQIAADADAVRAAVAPTGQVRAVLFDFDDTLQDRLVAFLDYARWFMDKYCPGLPPEEAERRAVDMRRRNNGGFVDYERFFDEVRALYGIATPTAYLSAERHVQFPLYTTLFERTVDTLHALRAQGLRIGIVTNGPLLQQWRKLDMSGLLPLVDAVCVSGQEGVHKPDPEIFRRAALRLGVACEDCVFVGDQVALDIAGAVAAGMHPVHIDVAGVGGTPEGVPCIADIAQLLALLEKM